MGVVLQSTDILTWSLIGLLQAQLFKNRLREPRRFMKSSPLVDLDSFVAVSNESPPKDVIVNG